MSLEWNWKQFPTCQYGYRIWLKPNWVWIPANLLINIATQSWKNNLWGKTATFLTTNIILFKWYCETLTFFHFFFSYTGNQAKHQHFSSIGWPCWILLCIGEFWYDVFWKCFEAINCSPNSFLCFILIHISFKLICLRLEAPR